MLAFLKRNIITLIPFGWSIALFTGHDIPRIGVVIEASKENAIFYLVVAILLLIFTEWQHKYNKKENPIEKKDRSESIVCVSINLVSTLFVIIHFTGIYMNDFLFVLSLGGIAYCSIMLSIKKRKESFDKS